MVTEPELFSTNSPLGSSDLSTCWTPEREAIKLWLSSYAPSLAELYEGAVKLVFEYPIPGHSHLVGHAVREIGNRLPAVIADYSFGRLEYNIEIDLILLQWKAAGLGMDGTNPFVSAADETDKEELQNEVKLPVTLVRAIGLLLSKHAATSKKPYERAEALFCAVSPENRKFVDAVRPSLLQWVSIIKWFMNRTHVGTKQRTIDAEELRTKFELFETCLTVITRKFFETTDELDAILKEANA
jgi:hypothetical protein